MSLTFFFGPLAGKLCDRFGPRVVSIMGALVSVVGLVSTSQAQSLYVMFFTYSILFAFGGCCTYTAVFVIVPKYFLQRRSLATGMIASGPGAGTLMMSPILALSIEGLGWRGAFLVMAGIVAIICVLGCTFDPNAPKDTSEEHVHVCIYAKEKGRKLTKNTEYLLLVFTSTIVVLGNSVPQVHLVSQLKPSSKMCHNNFDSLLSFLQLLHGGFLPMKLLRTSLIIWLECSTVYNQS